MGNLIVAHPLPVAGPHCLAGVLTLVGERGVKELAHTGEQLVDALSISDVHAFGSLCSMSRTNASANRMHSAAVGSLWSDRIMAVRSTNKSRSKRGPGIATSILSINLL